MLLTLEDGAAESNTHMKGGIVKLFGLTPQEYRQMFRGTHKGSQQTWVDFVDASVKELEDWIKGNKINTYYGLYNLIVKEHMLTNCANETLHQHLVEAEPSPPSEPD